MPGNKMPWKQLWSLICTMKKRDQNDVEIITEFALHNREIKMEIRASKSQSRENQNYPKVMHIPN